MNCELNEQKINYLQKKFGPKWLLEAQNIYDHLIVFKFNYGR